MHNDSKSVTKEQPLTTTFDLFRLSRARQEVGCCANTLRQYHADGLPFYRQGKAVWISRAELAAHIRRGAVVS
jgi:hypothetical protein